LNIFDYSLVIPTCRSLFRDDVTSCFIIQCRCQTSPFSFSLNYFKYASKLWKKNPLTTW